MGRALRSIFDDGIGELRFKAAGLYAIVIAANIAAWLWALAAFHDHPILLGTALLAYGLGLRHAVDADHIAAIDNVTRKLMQQGKRPVAVGLMFSLVPVVMCSYTLSHLTSIGTSLPSFTVSRLSRSSR